MFTGGTCFGVEFKQKNHRSTEPEKIFLSFQDRKIEKREPNSIIRTAALAILSMRIRLEGVEKKNCMGCNSKEIGAKVDLAWPLM